MKWIRVPKNNENSSSVSECQWVVHMINKKAMCRNIGKLEDKQGYCGSPGDMDCKSLSRNEGMWPDSDNILVLKFVLFADVMGLEQGIKGDSCSWVGDWWYID